MDEGSESEKELVALGRRGPRFYCILQAASLCASFIKMQQLSKLIQKYG